MGASSGGKWAYEILKRNGIQIIAFVDSDEKNVQKVYWDVKFFLQLNFRK